MHMKEIMQKNGNIDMLHLNEIQLFPSAQDEKADLLRRSTSMFNDILIPIVNTGINVITR